MLRRTGKPMHELARHSQRQHINFTPEHALAFRDVSCIPKRSIWQVLHARKYQTDEMVMGLILHKPNHEYLTVVRLFEVPLLISGMHTNGPQQRYEIG